MINTNLNLNPQQAANWISVLETLLLAKGAEVPRAVLEQVNPQYAEQIKELQAMGMAITSRPALCFRLDVDQEKRGLMLNICQIIRRTKALPLGAGSRLRGAMSRSYE